MTNSDQIRIRYLLPVFYSLTALFLPLIVAGCFPSFGVSKGAIEFKSLTYPASMSGYLYSPDGKILSVGNGLKSISRFSYEKRYWNVVYSLVQLSNSNDYVDAMNSAIKAVAGDGMVYVDFTVEQGALNNFILLNLLPVWPTNSTITIQGDIVKYDK